MIFNLGSINADLFYRVPHLPRPGETLASDSYDRGLGGKGANMSVAAARAASRVVHVGAVGDDGRWAKDRLTEYGVDTRHISVGDMPTGHAIIIVDDSGENQIVLFPGANVALGEGAVTAALAEAGKGDWLLMQNETSLQGFTAALARQKGMGVAYAAAPFDAAAVKAVLSHVDLLVLNAVEAAQLSEAMGQDLHDLDVADIVVTLGPDGCRHIAPNRGEDTDYPAFDVKAVDATGAGDTFTGYLLAGLDRGMPMAQAIARAQKAAAIMVTRHGTADVIPDLKDLEEARF